MEDTPALIILLLVCTASLLACVWFLVHIGTYHTPPHVRLLRQQLQCIAVTDVVFTLFYAVVIFVDWGPTLNSTWHPDHICRFSYFFFRRCRIISVVIHLNVSARLLCSTCGECIARRVKERHVEVDFQCVGSATLIFTVAVTCWACFAFTYNSKVYYSEDHHVCTFDRYDLVTSYTILIAAVGQFLCLVSIFLRGILSVKGGDGKYWFKAALYPSAFFVTYMMIVPQLLTGTVWKASVAGFLSAVLQSGGGFFDVFAYVCTSDMILGKQDRLLGSAVKQEPQEKAADGPYGAGKFQSRELEIESFSTTASV